MWLLVIALSILLLVYLLVLISTYTEALAATCRLKRIGLPGLPRGSMGWPIFGESKSFTYCWSHPKDPLDWYNERRAAHGDVFKTHLLGSPMVVMLGAEANKFILGNDTKLFTTGWPFSTSHLIGDKAIAALDFEAHKRIHRAINTFVAPHALRSHFNHIQRVISDHIASKWRDGEVLDAYSVIREMMFTFLFDYFFGVKDDGALFVHEFKETVEPYMAGLFSLPIDLPWTAFGKSKKARRKTNGIINDEIERRRVRIRSQEVNDEDSFMDAMVRAQEEREEGCLSNIEIITNLLSIFVGAFDTTVSALSSLVRHLALSPNVVRRLREGMFKATEKDPHQKWEGSHQCMRTSQSGKGGTVGIEELKKMEYMRVVVMETLRIEAPIMGGFKMAREDVVYKGVTIPKGWRVHYCTATTHLDGEYFVNPKEFVPERFEMGKQEAYSFVPFGQGHRMCPGKELVKTVMSLMAYHLVMRHDFTLEHFKDESIRPFFFIQPLHGLPLRLYPAGSLSMDNTPY